MILCLVTGRGRKRLVEESPNTTGAYKNAYVMRMTWQKLYKTEYLPYCVRRNFKPVSPANFCACRLQYRPLYKRCRKVNLCFIILFGYICLVRQTLWIYFAHACNLLYCRCARRHGVTLSAPSACCCRWLWTRPRITTSRKSVSKLRRTTGSCRLSSETTTSSPSLR